MKSAAKFGISEFQNPSSNIVFRVSGSLKGERIRRNFKTRAEAETEVDRLEMRRLQMETCIRLTMTRLSEAQAREAELAFQRPEGQAKSLTVYLNFALANYRDPARSMPIVTAIKEYLAMREADLKQGNLSHRQFTSFRCELRALEKLFPKMTIEELTAPALADFFKRDNISKKSYNNRRGLIGTFLKYCVFKDWAASNVVEKTLIFKGIGHKRGSATTLTAIQCAEMMEWAETQEKGALVPFIALCLFAGIRPDPYQGEISKLEAKDVRLDTGVILVEPHVSKVRMKRAVTIQPNLTAWLQAYPLDKFSIMPRGFRRLRLKFRKHFGLSHDVLRHTFISMLVAKFRSLGDAALQAGNSEMNIRKYYLALKSVAEAEQFFSIFPRLGQGCG